MTRLSRRSQALLDAARSAGPSTAARVRIGAGLAAQLPASALGSAALAKAALAKTALVKTMLVKTTLVKTTLVETTTSLGTATAGSVALGSVAKTVVVGVIALGAATGGGWVIHQRATAVRSVDAPQAGPQVIDATSPTAIARATPSGEARSGEARSGEARSEALSPSPATSSAVSSTFAASSPSSAKTPGTDRIDPPVAPRAAALNRGALDDETASLREAQQSLRHGDSAMALAVLDDLAARHPDGVLREERLAARVLALCAAGKVQEAQQAGRAFLSELPSSIHADRVRASCAFARTVDDGP